MGLPVYRLLLLFPPSCPSLFTFGMPAPYPCPLYFPLPTGLLLEIPTGGCPSLCSSWMEGDYYPGPFSCPLPAFPACLYACVCVLLLLLHIQSSLPLPCHAFPGGGGCCSHACHTTLGVPSVLVCPSLCTVLCACLLPISCTYPHSWIWRCPACEILFLPQSLCPSLPSPCHALPSLLLCAVGYTLPTAFSPLHLLACYLLLPCLCLIA